MNTHRRRIPDLLDVVMREFQCVAVQDQERKSGYPKTRARIEDFIVTQPEEDRDRLRKMLLPDTMREIDTFGGRL